MALSLLIEGKRPLLISSGKHERFRDQSRGHSGAEIAVEKFLKLTR